MEQTEKEELELREGLGQEHGMRPLAEIEETEAPVAEARFKTIIPSVFLVVFGVLLFFLNGVMAKVGGVVFAGTGLFGAIGVKDHVAAKLYEHSVLLIDHKAGTGIRIPYQNIAEWNIDNGIAIRTKDGKKYAVEAFSCGKALKVLRKCVPEKETKQLLNQRRKQEKLKNPLDLFK